MAIYNHSQDWENVIDVLENFDFDKEISKLANANLLFLIIQEFKKKELIWDQIGYPV